ncbi:MAG: universal stress protein [Anaerolineae bacterium]
MAEASRQPSENPYPRILVPLDGSKLAEAALRHAETLAWQFGSKIIVLRVIHVPQALGAVDLVPAYGLDVDRIEEEARLYLKGICGELRKASIEADCVLLQGPVAETIVDYAAREGIDLIVMSTHGRSGLSRWIFGSVAEKVLQGARCPVLLIPAKGA